MKKTLLLLPLARMFTVAFAVANPSTGDNNIVGIALGAGGVAVALIVVMVFLGKRK